MKIITRKTSETGKKFQVVSQKMEEVLSAQKTLAKEIGFKQWRSGYWFAAGGFSSLIFKDDPDKRIFKRVGNNE